MTSTENHDNATEVGDMVRISPKGKVYRIAAIRGYDQTARLTVAMVKHPQRAKQLPDTLAWHPLARLIRVLPLSQSEETE